MTTIPQVALAMQAVLGPVATDAARRSGFVQRRSKLSGARFVQALVFGWLANPRASLEELCQMAALLGVSLRPQSLDERFTERAAACLEQVLTAAMTAVIAADPVAIPLLRRFPGGVWLYDSTVITLPRALAGRWPGCGGSRGVNAALKLQVEHDLLTGRLAGLALQAGRVQDRGSPPRPRAGGLRLADLGYFSLPNLRAWGQAGGWWLSQVQAKTRVVTADGQSWVLSALLAARGRAGLDEWVTLGAQARLACRLLARPAPAAVAARRREQVAAAAQRKGQAVSQERLALCAWTVLATNLPADRLTPAEALVLARARWQVELLFKLWKSQNRVDEWRSQRPWRILCEVYAKLIGVIVQHWLLLVGCWRRPDRSLTKAAQTVRTHVVALASAVRRGSRRRLVEAIADLVGTLAAGCRINKSKRMPHTYQLLLALDALTAEAAAPDRTRPPAGAAPTRRTGRSIRAPAPAAHRPTAPPEPGLAA
jgi:DDE family transposase